MSRRFRLAGEKDIPRCVALINRAYRGESSRLGWTTEADLLSGLRIDEAGIRTILDDPRSFLLLALERGTIVGSIHGRLEADGVHFGLFAVEPGLQGRGVGKKLLDAAETTAVKRWGVSEALMEVISLRSELIDYYGRHGYQKTESVISFPRSPLWKPRVGNLEMCVLKKELG